MRYKELTFEGRNAVIEAFRSGKTIDKLFILDGCQDGPIKSIVREAKKTSTIINYVDKERLDRLANTGHHQGVVAIAATFCSLMDWFQIFTWAASPESSSQGSKLCVITGFFMVV